MQIAFRIAIDGNMMIITGIHKVNRLLSARSIEHDMPAYIFFIMQGNGIVHSRNRNTFNGDTFGSIQINRILVEIYKCLLRIISILSQTFFQNFPYLRIDYFIYIQIRCYRLTNGVKGFDRNCFHLQRYFCPIIF